jgi:hypothetical protein
MCRLSEPFPDLTTGVRRCPYRSSCCKHPDPLSKVTKALSTVVLESRCKGEKTCQSGCGVTRQKWWKSKGSTTKKKPTDFLGVIGKCVSIHARKAPQPPTHGTQPPAGVFSGSRPSSRGCLFGLLASAARGLRIPDAAASMQGWFRIQAKRGHAVKERSAGSVSSAGLQKTHEIRRR